MCTTKGTTKRSVYESQNVQILKHLQEHGSITAKEADQLYGCWRLSARIYDLRHKHGVTIKAEKTRTMTKCFARYRLVEDSPR